jgi:serine/threonine-protein kinase RsbT
MRQTALVVEQVAIIDQADAVQARQRVRWHAEQLGFGLTDTTKLITVTSELTRNMIRYAGSGQITIEQLNAPQGPGIRLQFEDHGPGIPDLQQAMQDGYSTGKGLGLGLPATRRLVHQFNIWSEPGRGTKIIITMWKQHPKTR